MYVVAYGNAFDGISMTGPFSTYEDALLFADGGEGGWEIVEISEPTTETSGRKFVLYDCGLETLVSKDIYDSTEDAEVHLDTRLDNMVVAELLI